MKHIDPLNWAILQGLLYENSVFLTALLLEFKEKCMAKRVVRFLWLKLS